MGLNNKGVYSSSTLTDTIINEQNMLDLVDDDIGIPYEIQNLMQDWDPKLTHNLGICYLRKLMPFKAKVWFEMTAKKGFIASQMELAHIYLDMKLFKNAKAWYEKAIENGDKNAPACIGIVAKQMNESSFEYYLQSTQQGGYFGQYMVALSYLHGDGVEKDIILAREYFNKAAEQGFHVLRLKDKEMFKHSSMYTMEDDTRAALNWFVRYSRLRN